MIYTSYYAMLNKIPKNIIPVSIAGKAPDFYKGLEYKKLAPKYPFFKVWKETGDNDYYIRHFQEEVLDKTDVMTVLADLLRMTNSYEICLLCYEKPGDFCHRHLVADWLNNQGVTCKEMTYE